MASKSHHPLPGAEEGPAGKRARPVAPPPVPQSSGEPLRVGLNPADCDLDFDIEKNGLQGHALHEKGFAYCWSGARATVGITRGKYCFGCKVISEQVVNMADTPADQQHVSRVGVSRGDDPVGNLGETMTSFGFGGTGKFSNAGKFSDYGTKFGVGDTIVCAVDLESRPLASIGFSKNGKWLGIAKQFDAGPRGIGMVDTPLGNRQWETALFPHVLLKNVMVQLLFSIEDGLVPEEGYKPWNSAIGDGNMVIGPSFLHPKECEVLMLVGLPASGKTTWAEKWAKEHPEKRYVLLGTNLALDQMKVPGLLRKQNYGERFDRLMDRATGIFNTLLARAAKTPRNYILDQTNVYKSARNRKLKQFVNYRKIAVVVFPTPDELKFRAEKRFKEMGKEVPADAVNEMLANYVLPMTKDMPGSTEFFDEVIFPQLKREEAQKCLDEMKRALGSSNFNVNKGFSPYSRESSMQSFSNPSAEKASASAASGPRSISKSYGLLPDRDTWNPSQVNPVYSGSNSFGDPHARFGNTGVSVPSNTPYGYPGYCKSSFHGEESDQYGSYSRSDAYGRSGSERSPIPTGDMMPHQTYGAMDAFGRSNFERLGPISRPNYGYSSPPPSYSSHDVQVWNPVVPQVGRSAAADPPYEWRSPPQNTHHITHDLPSYNSPGAHVRDPVVSRVGRSTADDPPYEWRSSLQNTHRGTHDLPSYDSPETYFHGSGVPRVDHQFGREPPYDWHSPLQNTYAAGSSYATPLPRPPSGIRPPVNHPPGSWHR